MRRAPTLVEKAKAANARQAAQFEDWPFVREWDELLSMPSSDLSARLISRDREMVRLRNSSPFYLAESVDFGDYGRRGLDDRRAHTLWPSPVKSLGAIQSDLLRAVSTLETN